ncbi:hypothetical protein AM493_13850 [Flavobacterium akiainvivens]|uniref:Uncharacterized protein n=1 Tax=Flavobacterium akiainvivens TaxID=1202724 RepID=A0A0M8MAF6_9FLAO|nr:hypothetical protein [Flavobacterium akiainvivens]KOS06993.1 hypothetical protein AM493_13850 [Flavobacterium akiainvivens]SFQ59430.1 hypothetical protein SAMN05444144_109107 [Flavobacterium akiainvivens]
MQTLITRADIARYKQVAKTPYDEKLNEQILDAQLLDVQPLIGEGLFNKIMALPEDYNQLLDGGVYEHDGISYTNYGLKMVLAYFAYARYIMFSSSIDTPFSVVEKLNDSSKPVTASDKKTIYNLNREAAMQVWQNVHNYLLRTGYPGFDVCKPRPSGMRFTKITP